MKCSGYLWASLLSVPLLSVSLQAVASADKQADLECMARNLFHEADGEGEFGRLLVAEAVLTRVASKHYPNTVCEVVYQRAQFSWTFSKELLEYEIPHRRWTTMMREASAILDGRVELPGINADHYYAPEEMIPKYRVPDWAIGQTPVLIYKGHKFYKIVRG